MTNQVMRRLIEEALNLSAVEEALKEIIENKLDPAAVAQEIWDTWQDELTTVAAEVAAEDLLPF